MSSADLDSLDRNSGKETGLNRDYYAGITQGRIEERERIIKIIEKRRDYDCSSALCKKHGLLCIYCQADNELIEIIKGEQK